METDRTLGVLAGGGPLPGYLAAACRDAGREVFIVAFKGHADARVVGDTPHVWVRLGAAKKALTALHGAGVKDIVLAGPVRRPSIVELRPDGRAAEFLARGILAKGDDGLLHALLQELESREGFRVIGADSLLKPLLAPEGLLGRHAPDETAVKDIVRGIEVARTLGAVDVAQAVVVQQGIVLALEAVEGTDALLARCGELRREGPGGVLVKLAKPGQERRADLPTIGLETVRHAAHAGLRGIAVQAGESLILHREAMVARADELDLFVIGVQPAFGAEDGGAQPAAPVD